MSRNPDIRWRKQDIATLKKVVKNFNAKIARILKKNPDAADYLPDKVSYANLKKDIETRKDYNSIVNSLKRFSKKGAEEPIINPQGVKTTRWEKREVGIKVGVINRKRAAKRKTLPISHERGTMGTVAEQGLDKKEWDWKKKTQYAWEKFKESVFKQSRANYWSDRERQYLLNYFDAIDNNFGSNGLVIKLLALRAGGFWMYHHYAVDNRLQIDFVYGASDMFGKIGSMLDAFFENGVKLNESELDRFSDILNKVAGSSSHYNTGAVYTEDIIDFMEDD